MIQRQSPFMVYAKGCAAGLILLFVVTAALALCARMFLAILGVSL